MKAALSTIFSLGAIGLLKNKLGSRSNYNLKFDDITLIEEYSAAHSRNSIGVSVPFYYNPDIDIDENLNLNNQFYQSVKQAIESQEVLIDNAYFKKVGLTVDGWDIEELSFDVDLVFKCNVVVSCKPSFVSMLDIHNSQFFQNQLTNPCHDLFIQVLKELENSFGLERLTICGIEDQANMDVSSLIKAKENTFRSFIFSPTKKQLTYKVLNQDGTFIKERIVENIRIR